MRDIARTSAVRVGCALRSGAGTSLARLAPRACTPQAQSAAGLAAAQASAMGARPLDAFINATLTGLERQLQHELSQSIAAQAALQHAQSQLAAAPPPPHGGGGASFAALQAAAQECERLREEVRSLEAQLQHHAQADGRHVDAALRALAAAPRGDIAGGSAAHRPPSGGGDVLDDMRRHGQQLRAWTQHLHNVASAHQQPTSAAAAAVAAELRRAHGLVRRDPRAARTLLPATRSACCQPAAASHPPQHGQHWSVGPGTPATQQQATS